MADLHVVKELQTSLLHSNVIEMFLIHKGHVLHANKGISFMQYQRCLLWTILTNLWSLPAYDMKPRSQDFKAHIKNKDNVAGKNDWVQFCTLGANFHP